MQQVHKIISIGVAALCFFSAPNQAQRPQQLSLEQAVALARENQPALRRYAVQEKIDRARLDETRLQRGLQLRGTADAQVNPFLPASVIPVGQFNLQNPTDETRAIRFGTWWQASVGLTANIRLIDPSLSAQLREQEFQNRLTENNKAGAETNVVAEVIRGYYALLLAEEEIRFLESDLERANRFRTDTENRQSGGTALPADLNTAQMQVNEAQLRLEQALENRQLARKNLAFRMGIPLEQAGNLTLTENLKDFLSVRSAAAQNLFDLAAAEENRSDMRQFSLDNQLQNLKIETEKSRLKPSLAAYAFAGLNNLTDGTPLFEKNSWFSNGNVGLQLSIPISGYWELKKRQLPLQLQQEQNAAELETLRQQARFEFESAQSAFVLAQRQLPIRQSDIELAKSNLELARAKYAAGGGLAADITDAETSLQQKQYAWLQTGYNLLLAELNMRLAQGTVK